jgi:acetyl-CoA acetyltransferase
MVVATVLGWRESVIRVRGVGHATDTPVIGDRDLLRRPALAEAVRLALAEAQLGISDIDLFEIDGLMLSDEAIAVEAMGLANPGAGFVAIEKSDYINRSGGSAAGWCYPAMGLVRLAECALRLREAVGAHGGLRRAMAVGASPVGAQTQTAAVVEAA